MRKTASEIHFDRIAAGYDVGKKKYSYYYESLKRLLGSLVPPDKNVYEIGCGTGDLLVSLKPKQGYGMDISDQMISISKIKYQKLKNLQFSTSWPKEKFDYIFMSDVIEHLEDPKDTFKKISQLMDKNTVFINTMANPVWEPVLMIAEKLGLKMPEGPHNRVKYDELRIMVEDAGMKMVKHEYKLLIPVEIPILTKPANKYLEKYFKKLAFIEYLVAVRS